MSGIQPDNGVGPGDTRNSLTNPDLAAGCDNLWYGPRCNPRLDPFAMNALIAEILNAVNGSCPGGDGLTYDCDRLDNLNRAIVNHITNYLFDCCLPENFPNASGACRIEQLVLRTDPDGCRRIARYTAASALLGTANACSVQADPSTQNLPADPNNPATYYTRAQLDLDVQNGTVDESRLGPNELVSMTINVPCDGTVVDFDLAVRMVFDPAANGGNGAESSFPIRIDGMFLLSPNNVTLGFGSGTNFQSTQQRTFNRTLNAGLHTIQVYVIAETGARPPAQVQSNCLNGIGGNTLRASVAIS